MCELFYPIDIEHIFVYNKRSKYLNRRKIMECLIDGIPIHYAEYGEGKPVLCIHGWSIDHRLMSGRLEPVFESTPGYRRIYPDLHGMGQTRADKSIKSADDTLEALRQFIDEVVGDENFLLAGESYGGRLSLALIHEMKERIDGLFLLCPAVDSMEARNKDARLPKRRVILKSDELPSPEENPDIDGFMVMAVTATPEVFEKYKSDIMPGFLAHDAEYLSSYYSGEFSPEFEQALREITYEKPTCILTGRQDDVVGYAMPYDILDRFPRATFAVLDASGHNLQIDNEPLFSAMTKDWLWRVENT